MVITVYYIFFQTANKTKCFIMHILLRVMEMPLFLQVYGQIEILPRALNALEKMLLQTKKKIITKCFYLVIIKKISQ